MLWNEATQDEALHRELNKVTPILPERIVTENFAVESTLGTKCLQLECKLKSTAKSTLDLVVIVLRDVISAHTRQLVEEKGGYDAVCTNKEWKTVAMSLGYSEDG
jgi:hypothetical protein